MTNITITDEQAKIIGREIGLGLAGYFFENMFSTTRDIKWSELGVSIGVGVGREMAKTKTRAITDADGGGTSQ